MQTKNLQNYIILATQNTKSCQKYTFLPQNSSILSKKNIFHKVAKTCQKKRIIYLIFFHNNSNKNTTSQVAEDMELSRSILTQLCNYELSCGPMYGFQLGYYIAFCLTYRSVITYLIKPGGCLFTYVLSLGTASFHPFPKDAPKKILRTIELSNYHYPSAYASGCDFLF